MYNCIEQQAHIQVSFPIAHTTQQKTLLVSEGFTQQSKFPGKIHQATGVENDRIFN